MRLLKRLGRQREAKTVFTDVLTQLRRAPKHARKMQADWIAIAGRELRD